MALGDTPTEVACKSSVRLDASGPMFVLRPSYRGLLHRACALSSKHITEAATAPMESGRFWEGRRGTRPECKPLMMGLESPEQDTNPAERFHDRPHHTR